METISEYNRRMRREKEDRIRRMYNAGVLCDTCRVEMQYTEVNLRNGLPRTREVRCPECGVMGEKE